MIFVDTEEIRDYLTRRRIGDARRFYLWLLEHLGLTWNCWKQLSPKEQDETRQRVVGFMASMLTDASVLEDITYKYNQHLALLEFTAAKPGSKILAIAATLPLRDKLLLQLRYREGRSYYDIAEVMGIDNQVTARRMILAAAEKFTEKVLNN